MYVLRYDPDVFKDLKKSDKSVQKKILKQVNKKLPLNPSNYGKPLRYELKGYWRLRVDDYRVVYEIDENKKEVYIWMIDKRKDDQVYIEFLKRLNLKL